jgi:hypothetical protein
MNTSTGFPKLDPGQFAVLQTDPRTGVPLASDGTWATTGQAYYRVFPSLEAAEEFCVASLREKRDSEWSIYDHTAAHVKSFRDSEYWQTLNEQMCSGRSVSAWRRLLNRIRGK